MRNREQGPERDLKELVKYLRILAVATVKEDRRRKEFSKVITSFTDTVFPNLMMLLFGIAIGRALFSF